MYRFVCMCTGCTLCGSISTPLFMCGSWRSTLGVSSSTLFLRQGLSLNWSSPFRLHWLLNNPPRSVCLHTLLTLPVLRLLTCSTTPVFYLGAREHFTHLAICLAHLCSFNTYARAHNALFNSVNFGISKPCHCYLCVY